MNINIIIEHEEIYPNEDFHVERIDTFKYKLNQDIIVNLNLKKHHTCVFFYSINNFKFKFLKADKQFISDRLIVLMERDKQFFNDFINENIPFKGNFSTF